MNVAEWIIVGILAGMLLAFLIVGIVALAKLMGFLKEARKLVEKGQDIADVAQDIAEHVDGAAANLECSAANLEDFTSIGGIFKSFAGRFAEGALKRMFGRRRRR